MKTLPEWAAIQRTTTNQFRIEFLQFPYRISRIAEDAEDAFLPSAGIQLPPSYHLHQHQQLSRWHTSFINRSFLPISNQITTKANIYVANQWHRLNNFIPNEMTKYSLKFIKIAHRDIENVNVGSDWQSSANQNRTFAALLLFCTAPWPIKIKNNNSKCILLALHDFFPIQHKANVIGKYPTRRRPFVSMNPMSWATTAFLY